MNKQNLTLEDILEIYDFETKEDLLKALKEKEISSNTNQTYSIEILDKYFNRKLKKAQKSHVIAISNQKGGEGKTTLSICLAEALAIDHSVLLVDWDPQANITRMFLNDLEEESIFDCLGYNKQINTGYLPVQAIIHNLILNLDIVPSSIKLANFTSALEFDDFERLKDVVEPLRQKYDYILIDCPPSLGLILENAFIAANYVLVPIQTRAFSIQGLRDLHESVKKIQNKANPNLKLLGAVLNLYEKSKALSGLSVTVEKYFPIFSNKILRREAIPQAQAKRVLLGEYDSVVFQMFIELSQEIKRKIDE